MHICELQHELQEARNEVPPNKVRLRTAAMDDANKLLSSGQFTPEEISYFLGIPVSVVQSEKSRIERYHEDRRRYLASGRLETPNEMAHFTIYQR